MIWALICLYISFELCLLNFGIRLLVWIWAKAFVNLLGYYHLWYMGFHLSLISSLFGLVWLEWLRGDNWKWQDRQRRHIDSKMTLWEKKKTALQVFMKIFVWGFWTIYLGWETKCKEGMGKNGRWFSLGGSGFQCVFFNFLVSEKEYLEY